jgi:hypothetical protein
MSAFENQDEIERKRVSNRRASYVLVGVFFPWLVIYLLYVMPFLETFLETHAKDFHGFHLHLMLIFVVWGGFGYLLSLACPPAPLSVEDEANIESLEKSAIYQLVFSHPTKQE